MRRLRVAAALALSAVAACAPGLRPPGPAINEPRLTETAFHTADGLKLPVRHWNAEGKQGNGAAVPKAVIVALHGFNDYSNFFQEPAAYLARHGIESWAYDQRGFGAGPGRGLWPGVDAFTDDLKTFARLVRQRRPETPLYLLGESMGGAVIMVAEADPDPPTADGVILSAPAVWGRSTMPWYQRWALWLGTRIMPGVRLTARGLRITPSDNIEMLKALGRDPLVIKGTRVDAIDGLANLMDRALEKAAEFRAPGLILYGAKDEIIPKRPTRLMLDRLPEDGAGTRRIALYPDGYHMLLRDLKAETPLSDIAHWIADRAGPLPSGADHDARTRLARLIGDGAE